MKKITFILTSMLFLLVGGVKADPTSLLILGGTNWRAVSLYDTSLDTNQREYGPWSSYESSKGESFYQTAIVKFEGGNDWQYCNLGQGQWKAAFTSGEQHRFVITFTTAVYNSTSYTGPSMDLQLVAIKNNSIIQTADIKEGASSGKITITEDYDEVVLIKTKEFGNDAFIPIASVTREISTASSVAAPTISPATDSTYDGDLTVTITKGAANDKVVYSVFGATTGNETAEFTTPSKTLTLTGTGKITVTAKGIVGSDESSEVTNTYTYDSNIPSGVISVWTGNKSFDSWGESISIDKSKFEDIKEGDYVYIYATHDGAVTDIGFRSDRDGYGWDEAPWYGFTNANGYTSGGNGAHGSMAADETYWWLKVGKEDGTIKANVYNNDDDSDIALDAPYYFKNCNTIIQGLNFTLTSVKIHKAKSISESSDNSITKYTDMIVNLDRSFTANYWNTICLPFVPTSAQADELFGSGYQLAEFTGVSGTTMQFTPITIGSFEAGKPYLVMPKTDCATGTTVLFNVDITAKNPTPVTWGDYTFTGTFTTKEFSGDECNTSRFVATGNELKKPNNNTTLKSLRCYFTVPAAAATARSLSFDVDEEGGTTSINTVQGSGVMVNGYYNLAGQRVAQPTKGLYIVNGKKVVIK